MRSSRTRGITELERSRNPGAHPPRGQNHHYLPMELSRQPLTWVASAQTSSRGADGGLAPHSVFVHVDAVWEVLLLRRSELAGHRREVGFREGCDETTCLGHDLVCAAPRFGEVPDSVAVSLAGPPTQPWRALQLIDGLA